MDEIELLGFLLSDVFLLVDDDPSQYIPSKDLNLFKGKQITILGYYVMEKYARTIKNENAFFDTFLDVDDGGIDTVHFPAAARRQPLRGKGFYRIKEKVLEEFGVYSIDVQDIQKVGLKKIRED